MGTPQPLRQIPTDVFCQRLMVRQKNGLQPSKVHPSKLGKAKRDFLLVSEFEKETEKNSSLVHK